MLCADVYVCARARACTCVSDCVCKRARSYVRTYVCVGVCV